MEDNLLHSSYNYIKKGLYVELKSIWNDLWRMH